MRTWGMTSAALSSRWVRTVRPYHDATLQSDGDSRASRRIMANIVEVVVIWTILLSSEDLRLTVSVILGNKYRYYPS